MRGSDIRFTVLAGLGGIGFVLLGLAVNAISIRARLPMPGMATNLAAATEAFAGIGGALRKPAMLFPLTWIGLTLFGAGLLTRLWRGEPDTAAWALLGFAGVLMQNVSFTCVEALRFGMAAAARHGRGSMAGLWSLSNVLFGFNQLFLALALLGFTAAGAGAGLVPSWQAVLGFASAALLLGSSLASPYNADGGNRFALLGLFGWLGWISWIVSSSVTLLRL